MLTFNRQLRDLRQRRFHLLPLAVSVFCLLSCDPKSEGSINYELPEVTDVVMYQVNPRVFAPENSLNAVADRIDSIQALGVNVICPSILSV